MPISDDSRIKLRHLQCFLEVARRRSMVGAADALSITQPAVSKTIRELEEILGARLLERSKKGVVPTAVGEVFLEHAGASVAALRQGLGRVTQTLADGGILVPIGVLPNLAATVMPEAIRRFTRMNSGVTVRVAPGTNAQLLSQLRVGELDIVFGRLAVPEKMAGLTFEYLLSERLRLAVRPGHPLLSRGKLEFAVIGAYPLVLPLPGTVIREEAERLLIGNAIEVAPNMIETTSVAFASEYVAMTDSVWIAPEGMLASYIASGKLVLLPIEPEMTEGPVGITIRGNFTPTPLIRSLMQCVRETVADLAQPPGREPAKGPEQRASRALSPS